MAKLDLTNDILLCEGFITEVLLMDFGSVVLEDIPSKLNNEDKQKFNQLIENENNVEICPQLGNAFHFNFYEMLHKYNRWVSYTTFSTNFYHVPWHQFYRENDKKYIPYDFSAAYLDHRKKNFKYTCGLLNAGSVDFTKEALFALYKNNNEYCLFLDIRGYSDKNYNDCLRKTVEALQEDKTSFNINFEYYDEYTSVHKEKKTRTVGTGRYVVESTNSRSINPTVYVSEETKQKEYYENVYENHGPSIRIHVPHRLRNVTDSEKELFEEVLKNQETIIDLYDKYQHLGIFSSEKKLITNEINEYLKFNYYAIIKYFINRISKNINGKYITNLENKIKSLKDENIKLEEEYKSYAVTCFKQRKKIKEDIKSNEHNIEVSEATLKWKKEEETLLLNDLDIFENKCKEILKK